MTFYPLPFGHVEVRIDPRDPRPAGRRLAELAHAERLARRAGR